MKNLFALFALFFCVSLTQAQQQQENTSSLFSGLLNVAEWVSSFNAPIERIDNRESLKRLRRELSYLSADMDEILYNKKKLISCATTPGVSINESIAEIRDLQNAMKSFQKRFKEINKLVPSEFKVAQNPLTDDIDALISEKMETLRQVKTALYGNDTGTWEEEINKSIDITKKINQKINLLKLKIEEKLE